MQEIETRRSGEGKESKRSKRKQTRKRLLYLYCQAKPCKDDDGASAKIAGRDPLALSGMGFREAAAAAI